MGKCDNISAFWLKSKIIGVPGVRHLTPKQLKEMEQNPPKWATGAMFMSSAGMVSPYKTTIALCDNAIQNGARVSLNTIVESMDVKDGKIVAVHTNRGTVYPKAVVNCAGVYSDVIADMAGDRTFTIHPRKGTDIILDKKKWDTRSLLMRAVILLRSQMKISPRRKKKSDIRKAAASCARLTATFSLVRMLTKCRREKTIPQA